MKYLDEKALNGQHDKQFMLILNHYLTSDWAHKLSEQVSVTSSTSHTSSLHYPYYNISTMKIYSIAAAMTIASANAAKDSHLRHLQDAADTPADAFITDLEMSINLQDAADAPADASITDPEMWVLIDMFLLLLLCSYDMYISPIHILTYILYLPWYRVRGSKKSRKSSKFCSPEAFHGLYRYQSTNAKFTKIYSVIFTDEDWWVFVDSVY